MNFEYTEDDKKFIEEFRRFCDKEIGPFAEEIDEKGEIPRSHFKKLADMGYTGMLVPEEFGGTNLGYLKTVYAQEILAEYCGATFFSVGASCGLMGLPLLEFGTKEQIQKYIPSLMSGEKIGCLGVTEPDAGSDVANIKSVVRRKNGKLLLNGQKTYITNAPIADFATILADYQEEDGKSYGLTAFLIETNRKGVSKGKPMKKMGLKGSPTGELFFEDVEVYDSDILGRKGRGFMIIMDAFNRERLSLGAYCVGTMAACLAETRKFSRSRKTFGRPIYKHQSVAFMLADMLIKYEASRVLLHETAWMMDEYSSKKKSVKHIHNGYPVDLTSRTAELKLMASTYAREVCNNAVQIHGGAGYMEEYKVARLYRDIKIGEIGGGTSEIQKQIVAHSEAKRIK
jgi:alkylation response protein AidB-like acyl-CoA dehydrogenase